MKEDNTTEIQLSKTKLLKLMLFSVAFLLLGLWMIIANPQTNNIILNDIVLKTLAGYGSVIMGILGIYFFSKKLLDKNPGIVLDEQGIYDNASAFNLGFIPWADISGVYERTVKVSVASKQQFITLRLENPEKYIAAEKNILKRKLLEQNAKNHGSPIQISTNGLKTSHKALLGLVEDYFMKYKQI